MTATYRDFANVLDTDTKDNGIPNATTSSGVEPYQPVPTTGIRTTVENFPAKVHYMLGEIKRDGLDHIVSWQPHGRCFMVHSQKEFEQNILPFWFRQTQLASFQRQLNIYGFQRITTGRDKNGYYHELFLRGKRFLAKRIQRNKIKGQGPRKPSSPDSEPNFYTMSFLPEESDTTAATKEASGDLQLSQLSASINENKETSKDNLQDALMALCSPLQFSSLRNFLPSDNQGASLPSLVIYLPGSNQSPSFGSDLLGNSPLLLSDTALAGPITTLTIGGFSQNRITNAIDQALLLAQTGCYPPVVTSNPQIDNQQSGATCLLDSVSSRTAFDPNVCYYNRSLQNLNES